MDCICYQDDRIRELTARVDKLEVKVDTFGEDIKEIKKQNDRLLWAIISVLLTSIGTLIMLILKMKGLN